MIHRLIIFNLWVIVSDYVHIGAIDEDASSYVQLINTISGLVRFLMSLAMIIWWWYSEILRWLICYDANLIETYLRFWCSSGFVGVIHWFCNMVILMMIHREQIEAANGVYVCLGKMIWFSFRNIVNRNWGAGLIICD